MSVNVTTKRLAWLMYGAYLLVACPIAGLAYFDGRYQLALIFALAFSPALLYGYFLTPTLSLSDRGLTATFPDNTRSLTWDEMTAVYAAGGNLILLAAAKRLAIPETEFWTGGLRKEAVALFDEKMRVRGLSRAFDFSAFLPYSRNVDDA